MSDHFYTTVPFVRGTINRDPLSRLPVIAGYYQEGIACNVYPQQHSDPLNMVVPLFSWFHPVNKDHFYTTDKNGEAAPANGYHLEGITCNVYPQELSDPLNMVVALFRWFHPVNKDHFYTTDENGETALVNGYNLEGIACRVYPQQQFDPLQVVVPLFRWCYPAPVNFYDHIRPLFRKFDIDNMKNNEFYPLDLSSYEAVRDSAHDIYSAVKAKAMPCDISWTQDKIDLFELWMKQGKLP